MVRLLQPLLWLLARSTHGQLARMVLYLKEENALLRAKLPKRLTVTAAERRRLVKFGKPLGAAIKELITIVSPRTFLRWVNGERTTPSRRQPARPPGRPRIPEAIRELVVRMADETGWGYTRILGELKKLGIQVARSTVVNILKEYGFDPGPKRGEGTWSDFIQRHTATLWACNFFAKRVVTLRGIVNIFVLFFIHIGTRRVHIAGLTAHPTQAWVDERAGETATVLTGPGGQPAYLLRDHDTKFEGGFDALLAERDVTVVRVGPRAPNLNAYAERFVQSIETECLDHFVVCGESHLRHIISHYVDWYHTCRPHQGVGNQLLTEEDPPEPLLRFRADDIECEERLGGLLRHYRRRAA